MLWYLLEHRMDYSDCGGITGVDVKSASQQLNKDSLRHPCKWKLQCLKAMSGRTYRSTIKDKERCDDLDRKKEINIFVDRLYISYLSHMHFAYPVINLLFQDEVCMKLSGCNILLEVYQIDPVPDHA